MRLIQTAYNIIEYLEYFHANHFRSETPPLDIWLNWGVAIFSNVALLVFFIMFRNKFTAKKWKE